MPKWVEKILKYNPEQKSFQAPFAIYLDLECLLNKEQSRENNNGNNNNNNNNNNNIEESYTEKKAKHEPLVGQCLQDVHLIKKKINLIITEEKIEKLCKKLKERAMKIINYEEKEMIPLTYEENKSYKEQEACHIC